MTQQVPSAATQILLRIFNLVIIFALIGFMMVQMINSRNDFTKEVNDTFTRYGNIAWGRSETCQIPARNAPEGCGYRYDMLYKVPSGGYVYLPGFNGSSVEELDAFVRQHDVRLMPYKEECTKKGDLETCTQIQPLAPMPQYVATTDVISTIPFLNYFIKK